MNPTTPAQVMTVDEMVRALSPIEPGTLLLVVYTPHHHTPKFRRVAVTKAEEERAAALESSAGLPSNVYIARYLGMTAKNKREVFLRLHVLNRGPAGGNGELRTLNPSRGQLHGIFLLPAEPIALRPTKRTAEQRHPTRAAA